MAGQLLNTLKASGAKPAASHEARLGIMVITILVFAFGFLVYHKMDMHQHKLTTAIASNAIVQPETPEIDPTAPLLNPQQNSSVNDPLISLEDLSDGSPFADSEPADSNMLPQPQESQPRREDRLADAGHKHGTAEELFPALGEPELSEPSNTTEQFEPEVALNEAADTELPMSKNAFGEITDSPAAPEISFDEVSLAESNLPFEISSSASEAIEIQPEFTEPEVESGVELVEISAAEANPNDISFDLAVEEPSSSRPKHQHNEEPVLLAMAEPQQPDEIELGFEFGERETHGHPAREERPEFPSFPAPEPEKKTAGKDHHQSDSRGFNAVKNPGRPKGGNTIRTAAGSGSDGKFSLAAFNYQNGASQAAPDDGSTFDSMVVQNGDNYTKISKRAYGTVRYFSALAVFNQNRIPEPKSMRPGMVVLVPKKEVLEERYPELIIDSQPKEVATAEFLVLEDGSPAYRVGERETISQIAERFLGRSSRWIEIYRLNQTVLKDPNKLKAGLILALPADAVEVNVVP